VLQVIGRAIDSTVREGDLSFRYGGDEFAILLPRTGIGQAVKIAHRVRLGIKEQTLLAGSLTASAGVACYPLHAADKSALISAADAALYRAKGAGGNRTVVWGHDAAETRRREPVRDSK
jgi:diguanylate cyclase (GGDEF)-like protein